MGVILVTGGAGYIGSHVVKELLKKGYKVVVLDNLQKGHKKAVLTPYFENVDLKEKNLLKGVFEKYEIDAIMHFAALSTVGESMREPFKYYENNILGGLNLLELMKDHNIKYFIFSSTAAVYGEPQVIPIPEDHPKNPTNVYGSSKLMFEEILNWYDRIYGIKYVSLRYFNAAGADPEGELGEDHRPETHLIPIVLKTALGQREYVEIYGTDYPTPDGTCIRDYIHVVDLAEAHILALEALFDGMSSEIFNLGNERGYSVREVISIAEKVVGQKIPVKEGQRRPGDPAVLIASSNKIKKNLKWKPKFNDLETMISTAWNWMKKHPFGYSE
ncbi:UDP-glucose 4-epimerase GalE [Dictyoglomus thermophilum]|uniref:UDP-glucose 4-epimerase n=2 Tax=Dictyoglomus thermophilum TaxID=14 RepID=B5YEV8_DICT6|nr:UDP-glucose 4-epimerase GalE [Dictyoglomus thermophilum]ACI18430.1 UDP-glucose 4-epimerase [Dictyoglomus thermophilum H-6-12]MCX7719678.1 UDP-glucose 4-epimerase GalE [Dictyoglomus thermophilum]TYT21114.1 UDP-glucose 4-epimerase GalE [Dictyoglomus thermophilum]